MAVKLGKWLTAREIWGKKKHKILWCMRDFEGVFCGGQCPFCFGLYLGKEEVTGSNPVSSSTQPQGIISNTPQVMRGVCVCACGCVYASQKCGRSPRSSFFRCAPKLSRCSLIFAPRDRRLPPPDFLRMSGFCDIAQTGFSPFANAIFLPHRKFFRRGPRCLFSPGDPESPCVTFARRSDGAKCAIPSLRSLQIRLAAPKNPLVSERVL